MKKEIKLRRSIGTIIRDMLCGLLVFSILFQIAIIPTFALDTEHPNQIITAEESIIDTTHQYDSSLPNSTENLPEETQNIDSNGILETENQVVTSQDILETTTTKDSITEASETKIKESEFLIETQVETERQEFSEDKKLEEVSNTDGIVEDPTNTIKDDELQDLHRRIQNLSAPTEDESEDFTLNEKDIKLDIGKEFQFQLADTNGTKIDGVEWFCRTIYPYDRLYSSEQIQQENCCSINSDGIIKANKSGFLEVWAKYKNYLYMCKVTVRTKAQTFDENANIQTERKAEEIAQNMLHLNDVDKVLAAHDYLVDNVQYDHSYLRKGAYGALIDGKAVCMGYAQAFQKLMEKLNVESSVVVGNAAGQAHAWNRVKLYGKWYYLDVTFDDQPRKPLISYKYFLIDRDTLGKDHSDWYFPQEEQTGGLEYRYYPYKKMGIIAENQEQLENVFKSQLNSNNFKNMFVYVLVHKNIDQLTVKRKLESLVGVGTSVYEESSWKETINDYTLYYYQVNNIPTHSAKKVKFVNVLSGNSDKETTSKLVLTFDKNIDNLSVNDIVIKGVDKRDLKQIKEGIYELSISNISIPIGSEIIVQVNKRGFEISPNTHSVRLNIVKESAPAAVFKAIDDRVGLLENIEVGMKYTVGDGVWHKITSTEPVRVKTIYQRPISIIKTSSDASRMDSDPQIIRLKNQNEPTWVKAVSCTGKNQNGKIIHVSIQMEYQRKDDTVWTSCTGREITGLASGEYYVRYKASGSSLASPFTTVHIDVSPIDSTPDGDVVKPDISDKDVVPPPVPNVEPTDNGGSTGNGG
ncbi:transglutaminase domain-containing protein, partial [Tissierella praeacuta]